MIDAPPDRPTLDFERYVPFGLTAIANKIARAASRDYLQRYGVGINEWRVLANLRARPGTTAQALCQHSGLDKAAVSRSIRLLEDAGMIATGSDAGDGRSRSFRLTPAGDTLHDRLIAEALDREARLLTGFSDAERDQLLTLLARLHANVPKVMRAD